MSRPDKLLRWLVAGALTAGVLLGTLVGFLGSTPPERFETFDPRRCPTVGTVERLDTKVTVVDHTERVEVRASATARIREPGAAWVSRSGIDALARCLFANGQTREFAEAEFAHLDAPQLPVGTYRFDRTAGTLTVNFRETAVEPAYSGSPELRLEPSTTASDQRVAASVVVTRLGRTLHLDLAPCRSRLARLACQEGVPTTVTVEVPDSIRPHDRLLPADPAPAVVADDTDRKTTVSTWNLTDPGARIMVELPLRWSLISAAALRAPHEGNVSFGSWALAVDGEVLLHGFSSFLAIVVGAIVLARIKRTRPGPRGLAGVALVYAIVAIALATRIAGYFQDVDALVTAAVWAAVTVVAADVWRRTLISAALVGVVCTVAAVIWGEPERTPTFVLGTVSSVGVVIASVAGVLAVGTRLRGGVLVLPDGAGPLRYRDVDQRMRRLRRTVGGGAVTALVFAVAVVLGDSVGRHARVVAGVSTEFWVVETPRLVAQISSSNISWVILSGAALFVLAGAATRFTEPVVSSPHPAIPAAAVGTALTFLIAVVAQPPVLRLANVSLPAWFLTWIALAVLVVRWPRSLPPSSDIPMTARLREAVAAEQSRARLLETDVQVSAGSQSLDAWERQRAVHRRQHPGDRARDLLMYGPTGNWLGNARCAAWAAALLAVLPLGYYLWGVLQALPARLEYNGVLYLVVDVLSEWARWIGTGFAFGALYGLLRPRTGAAKGAVLALGWAAGALLTELGGRWLGIPASGLWLYISLQMFLFLVVLGAVYDLMTINAAGGSWRRVSDLYRAKSWRQRLAYAGPVVAAVAGLIVEVRSGAGLELAQQLLSALSAGLG